MKYYIMDENFFQEKKERSLKKMSVIEKARQEWDMLDERKRYYEVSASEFSEIVEKYDNNLINGGMDLFIFAFIKGMRFQKAMARKQVRG